ncbi:MAG: DUF4982 domain-containing protein [Bacteroidaceae bacterium]|nr:DUF4982 domain-containing protein [Bacteroidaceae bacterium]
MKKTFLLLLAIVYSTTIWSQRQKTNFDFDWQFRLNKGHWEEIQLPHDWSINMPFNEKLSGCNGHMAGGWGEYKKTFHVAAKDKDKSFSILFDGIYNRSTVYINGHKLGFRPYGFCYIEYDMTPYIHYDKENEIYVTVNSPNDNDSIARWYTGNGIYRHAWLIKTNKKHIASYGTYIRTIPPHDDTENWGISIKTTTVGDIHKKKLIHIVFDNTGKQVAKGYDQDTIIIKKAKLWDGLNAPNLYSVKTYLYEGSKLLDTFDSSFGLRTAEFTSDKGFYLNGKHLKLKGFCLHQDDGPLGSALPIRSMERKLEIIKEYGVNAIRCAHNQPAPEFLDLCDKMGFLVIDEAFDKWKSGYYAEYFDQWWQQDLNNMIVRDRNHPSIITWSIGNELQEAWDATRTGADRAKMLQDFVHAQEPTRPVCMACQNNHNGTFSEVTDVIGYNYLEARMLSDHKKYPERKFMITEELPYYCGAEGNIRAYDTNNPWNIIEDNDFIAGGFIWAGTDYIGEAQWPSHGWPTGLFDINMIEKPRALFHRAMWNKDKPIVGIAIRDESLDIDHGRDLWQWPNMASIWNFPFRYQGLVLEVNTTTNCEKVQLSINNKVMGIKNTKDFDNHTIIWHVPYLPGKIEAKGINGTDTVAHYEIRTAGQPHHLRATADRQELKADGQDLSYIQIELLDKDNNLVQHMNRHVTATIEGEGKLLGCINSDLRRTTPFTSKEDDTYFGRMMAIVQTTRKAGAITLKFHSEGMDDIVVKLYSK